MTQWDKFDLFFVKLKYDNIYGSVEEQMAVILILTRQLEVAVILILTRQLEVAVILILTGQLEVAVILILTKQFEVREGLLNQQDKSLPVDNFAGPNSSRL